MTDKRRLIVVVGASGRQGGSVIQSLLEHSDQWLVRGVTTDLDSPSVRELLKHGVDIVHCDTNNREECCQVFTGAYGVFAVTNHWEAKEIGEYEQAVNLVEAAKEANVKHLIFSLCVESDPTETIQCELSEHPRGETRIERYIRELPCTSIFAYTTLVRVGFYYQNFMSFFMPNTTNLEFRYPLFSSNRIPFFDARDTGKVIAQCFQHPERWSNGQVIPIVAEHLSMEEICASILEVTAKEVKFLPLSSEEAPRKLNRYIVNNMRWYCEIASIDDQQSGKTREICPDLKKFIDWMCETNRLLE